MKIDLNFDESVSFKSCGKYEIPILPPPFFPDIYFDVTSTRFLYNSSRIILEKYCTCDPKFLPPYSTRQLLQRAGRVAWRGGWTVCVDGLRYRRSFKSLLSPDRRAIETSDDTREEAGLTHGGRAYKSDLNKLYERARSFTRSILRTKRGERLKQRGSAKESFASSAEACFTIEIGFESSAG